MRRPAIALLATLLAIVCIGALIVAAAFGAAQNSGVSTAARDETRALAAAERGVWAGYRSLAAADTALALGASRDLAVPVAHAGVVAVSITRLAGGVFAVIADASVRGARRRVALFAVTAVDSAGTFVSRPLPGRSWAELP